MASAVSVDKNMSLDALTARLSTETSNRAKNALLIQGCELLSAKKEVRAVLDNDAVCQLLLVLRKLMCDQEYVIRTQSLRCCRYVIAETVAHCPREAPMKLIETFYNANMDLFVVRSLERENKSNTWERQQALKVVETLIASCAVVDKCLISRSIYSALIAMADHVKDKLHVQAVDCMKTLLLNPTCFNASKAFNSQCVLSNDYSSGLKPLVKILLSTTAQKKSTLPLVLTLLHLIDRVETRSLLAPGASDLQHLLAILTETQDETTSEAKEAKRQQCHFALVTMLRTWTGTLLLTSDTRCLPSLVRLLGLSSHSKGSNWARESIFELLFDLTSIVKRDAFAQEMRRRARQDVICSYTEIDKEGATATRHLRGVNLLYNYLVMILLAFMESELFHTLLTLAVDTNDSFSALASRLLDSLLFLSTHLLPSSLMPEELLSMPSAIELGARRDGGAMSIMRSLHSTLRVNAHLTQAPADRSSSGTHSSSVSHSISNNNNNSSHTNQMSNNHFSPRDDDLKDNWRKNGTKVYGIRLMAILQGTKIEQLEQERDLLRWRRFGKDWHGDHFSEEGIEDEAQEENEDQNTSRIAVQQLHSRAETLMDEASLMSLVKASNVTATKDWKQWDFYQCLHILRHSLLSAYSLSLVNAKTKFIKRLLSFLNPYKMFFSELEWNASHYIYAQVGFHLFSCVITKSTFGQLNENVFFLELCGNIFTALFEELDGTAQDAAKNVLSSNVNLEKKVLKISKPRCRPFSRLSMLTTLSRCYMDLIQVLSSSGHAHFVFRKFDFFTKLKNFLTKEKQNDEKRPYLIRMILRAFNYVEHVDAREMVLLACRLDHSDDSSTDMRLHVLSILRLTLRDLVAANVTSNFLVRDYGWCVPLVSDLLRSSHGSVTLSAMSLLDEMCVDGALLTLFLTQPNPLNLSQLDLPASAKASLQLRALGTSQGVKIMAEDGSLSKMVQFWYQRGVYLFAQSIEDNLFTALHDPNANNNCQLSYITSIRSKSDNYYYRRLHDLPWRCLLRLEHSNKKSLALLSDALVYTSYTTANTDKNKDGFSAMTSEADQQLSTYVQFTVLNAQGVPEPTRVPSNATLKARPLLGGDINEEVLYEQDSERYTSFPFCEDFDVVCTPSERAALVEDTSKQGRITHGGVTWRFTVDVKARETFLESVQFEIPVFVAAPPTVRVPNHLYGALARTEKGLSILAEYPHITEFVRCVSDRKAPFSIQQRGFLWAIGTIAASPTGVGYLCKHHPDIFQVLSEDALTSHTLSKRGSCFYIMGLLSFTAKGREILNKLQWTCAPSPAYGIVIPHDRQQFLSVAEVSTNESWATSDVNVYGLKTVMRITSGAKPTDKTVVDSTPEEQAMFSGKALRGYAILGYVSNLCNHVTQKQSLAQLQQMKRRDPDLFASGVLLFEVWRLLQTYTFQLPARRFIIGDLFHHVVYDAYTLKLFDQPFPGATHKEVVCKALDAELAYFDSLRAAQTPQDKMSVSSSSSTVAK